MSRLFARRMFNLLIVSQLVATSFLANASTAQETEKVKPHIDLAFCIDTTGSMQGEIDNVKAKTKEIVAKLAGGKPTPVIRVGLVAFRDRGDQYVTKVFPFSEDIDKVVKDISSLAAQGGGDGPESVNEALHVAVNDLKWADDKKTLKMLFLIGDAAPHKYANDYDWRTESKTAIGKGIQINTLACEGLQSYPQEGIECFKEIAKLADGRFENLAYRQEVVEKDGKRETIVSSAGKMYRVKGAPGAAGDAWRDGMDKLTARGEAEAIAAPAAFPTSAMARRASGRMAGGGGAMLMSAPGAPMAGFAAADSYMGGGGGSRRDSNLADVVLQATKEAAAKKLNVDFKAK